MGIIKLITKKVSSRLKVRVITAALNAPINCSRHEASKHKKTLDKNNQNIDKLFKQNELLLHLLAKNSLESKPAKIWQNYFLNRYPLCHSPPKLIFIQSYLARPIDYQVYNFSNPAHHKLVLIQPMCTAMIPSQFHKFVNQTESSSLPSSM